MTCFRHTYLFWETGTLWLSFSLSIDLAFSSSMAFFPSVVFICCSSHTESKRSLTVKVGSSESFEQALRKSPRNRTWCWRERESRGNRGRKMLQEEKWRNRKTTGRFITGVPLSRYISLLYCQAYGYMPCVETELYRVCYICKALPTLPYNSFGCHDVKLSERVWDWGACGNNDCQTTIFPWPQKNKTCQLQGRVGLLSTTIAMAWRNDVCLVHCLKCTELVENRGLPCSDGICAAWSACFSWSSWGFSSSSCCGDKGMSKRRRRVCLAFATGECMCSA